MRLPTTRAMMSFGPPGGNGTIRWIGPGREILRHGEAGAQQGETGQQRAQ